MQDVVDIFVLFPRVKCLSQLFIRRIGIDFLRSLSAWMLKLWALIDSLLCFPRLRQSSSKSLSDTVISDIQLA